MRKRQSDKMQKRQEKLKGLGINLDLSKLVRKKSSTSAIHKSLLLK
jgi:hypothetical protein